jgi:hypothetical protein
MAFPMYPLYTPYMPLYTPNMPLYTHFIPTLYPLGPTSAGAGQGCAVVAQAGLRLCQLVAPQLEIEGKA